jgi:peptidoglycan hydrolase-like protein with peptidoglycan-binding domain
MVDPWILTVQNYINITYAGTPVGQVEVTGRTGWPTMYALTRALQRELGIASLSNTFGPGTVSALDAYGAIGLFEDSDTSNDSVAEIKRKRINNIIRAGLFAKGYNGGSGVLDGTYSTTTIAAVKAMRTDMGLAAGDGKMTSKVFKSLLTMDAYVLLGGGSDAIRSIQRDLNGRYSTRRDFAIIPADGIFSRGVQSALLYALQFEIGMADGTANGNFGPGTQSGLKAAGAVASGSVDTTRYFVHLFQAALTFNGYPTPYTGTFSSGTAATTRAFQEFSALPVTGKADFVTWASLLTSTGDTSRPGTAVDCITTITPARAATLIANGYRTVGRYLTNSQVVDPLDKKIKLGELATIFANGLTVFPIFQEGGTGTEFFDYEKGVVAGGRAHAAARSFGFKAGTTIYFAVDFDALQDDIDIHVIPHFRGINEGLAALGSDYKVGIYGARNTCSTVSSAGLAELSFVSGMSTGFSGNLGFPLPKNWAFDQILEYTIGTGPGAIGIDKNIQSGRDSGQSSVEAEINSHFFAFLDWLQALAHSYVDAPGGAITLRENDLVLQYLRYRRYGGTDNPVQNAGWAFVAGILDWNFIDRVNAQSSEDEMDIESGWWLVPGVLDPSYWVDLVEPVFIEAAHMAACANAVTNTPYADAPEFITTGDFGGWAGDLVTLLADYKASGKTSDAKAFAFARTGGINLEGNTFSFEDLVEDADGANLGYSLKRSGTATTVAVMLRGLISVGSPSAPTRFKRFYDSRFHGSVEIAKAAARSVTQFSDDPVTGTDPDTRTLMLAALFASGLTVPSDFTEAERDGIADGFAEKLAYLSA